MIVVTLATVSLSNLLCWHGIEHGLELLKKGIIWRVGDGKSISIWRDNWFPRNSAISVMEGKTNTRVRIVHQLTLPHTNQWDEALVRFFFTGEGVLIGL